MTLVFIQIRAREAIQFDFPKMKQKSKYKITVKFFKKKKWWVSVIKKQAQ